jgi:hypothetical protein
MALPKFIDEQKKLSDFGTEVWAECPACAQKAIATRNDEKREARILCTSCGYNKVISTAIEGTKDGKYIVNAHAYFGVQLWLKAPYKNEIFFALNGEHLAYLESYIGAGIRENKDRKFFTLVEKLPKFMQVASNRESLLKLIEKLRKK